MTLTQGDTLGTILFSKMKRLLFLKRNVGFDLCGQHNCFSLWQWKMTRRYFKGDHQEGFVTTTVIQLVQPSLSYCRLKVKLTLILKPRYFCILFHKQTLYCLTGEKNKCKSKLLMAMVQIGLGFQGTDTVQCDSESVADTVTLTGTLKQKGAAINNTCPFPSLDKYGKWVENVTPNVRRPQVRC